MSGAMAHEEQCSLMGGIFVLFMQVGLGFTCFMVLVWKKLLENGQRTWLELLLDTSKQLIQAGWLNMANMIFATLSASELPGVDACAWYSANIWMDSTVGVMMEWGMLAGFSTLLALTRHREAIELLETGSYWSGTGSDRSFRKENYLCQLLLWLTIVTTTKISLLALLHVLPYIAFAVSGLLTLLDADRRVKLFVVMVVLPMTFSIFQFVITDSFLQRRPAHARLGQLDFEAAQLRCVPGEDEKEIVQKASGGACLICGV